jgi:cytochrome c biogenesis protein CcmG/thiol:disulfide interchange protein DsbE
MLDPPEHDGHADRRLREPPTTRALRTLVPLVVIIAVVVGYLVVSRSGQATVKIGQPAPTLAGTTIDGATLDLASLRGRPVIVNFWYSTCVPCREEFPLLVRELQAHAGDDLAVVGVLYDANVNGAKAFAKEMGATWPTIQDPDHALSARYLVVAAPQSYFVDREGVVRALQVGPILDEDFQTQFAKIAG